ncbi:hypothetical protein, partial [Paraburkholderia franconis]|uniref:hypothetical protein n=1 Tax=Paraburkholderia franconis TaxID=2654983 RepID=UPI001D100FF5
SVQTCYCFRVLSNPVAHSKSLTDGSISQTFLNFFLCESRLLLPSAAPENHRAPSSSTHICRLLVFKEHRTRRLAFVALLHQQQRNEIMKNLPASVNRFFCIIA